MGNVFWVISVIILSIQVCMAGDFFEVTEPRFHTTRRAILTSGQAPDPFRIEGPKPRTELFTENDIENLRKGILPAFQQDVANGPPVSAPQLFDGRGVQLKNPLLLGEIEQLDPIYLVYLKQQLRLQANHPPAGFAPMPPKQWADFSAAILKSIHVVESNRRTESEERIEEWKKEKNKKVLLKAKETVDEKLDEKAQLLKRLEEWKQKALVAYLKQVNYKSKNDADLLAFLEREVKFAEGQTNALSILIAIHQVNSLKKGIARLEKEQKVLSNALFLDRFRARKLGEFDANRDILSKGQSIWTDMSPKDFKFEIKSMNWNDREALAKHLEEAKRSIGLRYQHGPRYEQIRQKGRELEFYTALGHEPAKVWTEMILADPKRKYLAGLVTRERMQAHLEKIGEQGRNELRALLVKEALKKTNPDIIKALKKLDRQYFKDICDPKYPLDISLALQESWTQEREEEIKNALDKFKGSSAEALKVISQIEAKYGPHLGNRCGTSREFYEDLGYTINLDHRQYKERMEKARKVLAERGEDSFNYSSLKRSFPRWMNVDRKAAHREKNHRFPTRYLYNDGEFDKFAAKARLSDTQTLLALKRHLEAKLAGMPRSKKVVENPEYFGPIRGLNLVSNVLGYRYGKRFDRFLPLLGNAFAFTQAIRKISDDDLKDLYDYLGQVPYEYLRRKYRSVEDAGQKVKEEKKPYNRARSVVIGEYTRRLDARHVAEKSKSGKLPKRAIYPWLTLEPSDVKKYFEGLQPMEDDPKTPHINEAKLDRTPQWTLFEHIQDMQKKVTDHFGGDKLEDAARVRAHFQGPLVVMDNVLQEKIKKRYRLEMKLQEVTDEKGKKKRAHFWHFGNTELSPSKIQNDPFLCRTLIQLNPGSKLNLHSSQAWTCQRAKAMKMNLPHCKKFEKVRPDVHKEYNLCTMLANPEREEAVVVGNWVIGPSRGKDKKFELWELDNYNKETKELSEKFEKHLVDFLKASARANNGLSGTWNYLQKAFSSDPNFKTDNEKWMDKEFAEAKKIIGIFQEKYGLKNRNVRELFSLLQKVLSQNGDNIRAQIDFLDNYVKPGAIFLAVALPVAVWAAPITVAVGATFVGGLDRVAQWAEDKDAIAKGERPQGWNPLRTVFMGAMGGVAAPLFVAIPELMIAGGLGFGVKHGVDAAIDFKNGDYYQGGVNIALSALSFFGARMGSKSPVLGKGIKARWVEVQRVGWNIKAPKEKTTAKAKPEAEPVEPIPSPKPQEPVPTAKDPVASAPKTEPVGGKPTEAGSKPPAPTSSQASGKVPSSAKGTVGHGSPRLPKRTPRAWRSAKEFFRPLSFLKEPFVRPARAVREWWVKNNVYEEAIEPFVFAARQFKEEFVDPTLFVAGRVLKPITAPIRFIHRFTTKPLFKGAARVREWYRARVPQSVRENVPQVILLGATATYIVVRIRMEDGVEQDIKLRVYKKGKTYQVKQQDLDEMDKAVKDLETRVGEEKMKLIRKEVRTLVDKEKQRDKKLGEMYEKVLSERLLPKVGKLAVQEKAPVKKPARKPVVDSDLFDGLGDK